ncbi:hypothetical protein PG989_001689 [Apiospora arundinis]
MELWAIAARMIRIPSSDVTIPKAPQLSKSGSQEFNFTTLTSLSLQDAGGVNFPSLTSVDFFYTIETSANFPALATASRWLRVANPQKGHSSFLALSNPGNVAISSGTFSFGSMLDPFPRTDLVMQQSLVIGPWSILNLPIPLTTEEEEINIAHESVKLTQLTRVGGDLNITKNSGVLETSFDRLTVVDRLNIMNNPNSRRYPATFHV